MPVVDLKAHGAILLISCYELGHQPVGAASPLGFLERTGYQPSVIDLAVEPLDPVKVGRAGYVGISVPMHTALRLGVQAAARVRELNPTAHISFFGLYASLNADYLLGHGADSVIGGEYEAPLVALIQALDGDGDLGKVPGISSHGHPGLPWLARLDFAVPSRSALPPLEQYARLEHNGTRQIAGYVEASRGCLHRCLHCPITPIYDGRFFVVPEAVVLEDIRRQVAAGARHITFGDADFLNGPGHSLKIVRTMHDKFPGLTFDFTAKIEHLLKHRQFLPEFAASGGLFVISAVESLSDTVLARLEKGHTRADVIEALRLVRGAEMTLRPSFVAFTPWTTLEDYLEMFEFVEREGLMDAVDPVQFTIRLLIPPGSALLAPDKIKTVTPHLGPLVPDAFAYQWTHPDPRMDHLHHEVTRLVEKAGGRDEDPAVTFERLLTLAYAAHGSPPPPSQPLPSPDRLRPPRLTEPWFCCAEPTQDQLRPLEIR